MKQFDFQEEVKKDSNYVKIPINSVTVIASLVFVLFISVFSYWFGGNYRLRSPIVITFRLPFEAIKTTPLPNGLQKVNAQETTPLSPTLTPKKQSLIPEVQAKDMTIADYIDQAKHKDILRKIYTLESSQGRNDGCKDNGKLNGFGYGQNRYTWNCFDTPQEVVNKVDAWFDRELQTKTLAEALCYYNKGIVENNCTYYQNYLSL